MKLFRNYILLILIAVLCAGCGGSTDNGNAPATEGEAPATESKAPADNFTEEELEALDEGRAPKEGRHDGVQEAPVLAVAGVLDDLEGGV